MKIIEKTSNKEIDIIDDIIQSVSGYLYLIKSDGSLFIFDTLKYKFPKDVWEKSFLLLFLKEHNIKFWRNVVNS